MDNFSLTGCQIVGSYMWVFTALVTFDYNHIGRLFLGQLKISISYL